MRMIVSEDLSRLVAFARRRDETIDQLEYLDDHLHFVAVWTYVQLLRNSIPLAYLGLLAGLLHDIGKALEVYQQCRFFSEEDHSCLYTGHEVFSAMLAREILSQFSMPQDIINDLHLTLNRLGISVEASRLEEYAREIVLYSILIHHEAMGDPIRRFIDFKSRVVRQIKDAKDLENLIRVSNKLIHALKNAARRTRELLKLEHLNSFIETLVSTDNKILDNCNNIIRRLFSLKNYFDYFSVKQELLNILSLYDIVTLRDERLLVLARLITGSLIMADIYVACTSREDSGRAICKHLARLFESLRSRLTSKSFKSE